MTWQDEKYTVISDGKHVEIGIINGHPVSCGSQLGYKYHGYDAALIKDLPTEVQKEVIRWVKAKLTPIKTVNTDWSSYGLKHILQHDIGIYLTNNQFKDAMLICGYRPKDVRELNWVYTISKKSKAFK